MASSRSFLTDFTIMTTVMIGVVLAQEEFCTVPPPKLLHYGRRCTSHSQCVTNLCDDGLCVCPGNEDFQACTSSCLPECKSNSNSLNATSGRISRPDYPKNTAGYNCNWIIEGRSASSYVVFSLNDLDLCPTTGCKSDFIEVRDGGHSAQLLFKSCNRNDIRLQIFASRSNSLKITVKQEFIGYRTFTGTYRIYDRDSVINDTYGYIASPGFPIDYPSSADYSWTLVGKSVTLRILSAQLEDCCDYVSIRNGSNSSAPELQRINSTNLPITMSAKGSGMHVKFHSDRTTVKKGFSAAFYHQELGHEELCSLSIPGMCLAPNLTCRLDWAGVPRCLCVDGMFLYRDECTDTGASFGYKVDTDVVTLTASPEVTNISYSVTWFTAGEMGVHFLEGITAKNFNVTGLTPGQRYTLQIKSSFTADRNYDDKVATYTVSIVAVPAMPGRVNVADSNLLQAPYVIKFSPSRGRVQYYVVSLQSFNFYHVYNVSAPELNVSHLTADTNFLYTITAYNSLHNKSAAVSGEFKTPSVEDKPNVITIVVAVTGAVGCLIILLLVIALVRRRRQPSDVTGQPAFYGLAVDVEEMKKKGKKKKRDRTNDRTYRALPTERQLNVIQEIDDIAVIHPVDNNSQSDNMQDPGLFENAFTITSDDLIEESRIQNEYVLETDGYHGNTRQVISKENTKAYKYENVVINQAEK